MYVHCIEGRKGRGSPALVPVLSWLSFEGLSRVAAAAVRHQGFSGVLSLFPSPCLARVFWRA